MANILDEVRNSIESHGDFFSSVYSNMTSLRQSAFDFLDSETYNELIENFGQFMDDILDIHGKDHFIGIPRETMYVLEMTNPNLRRENRTHYIRLWKFYLLGLYIYHEFPKVKTAIDNDIESSPNEIQLDNRIFDYSADSIPGEFQYRWRLAALIRLNMANTNTKSFNNFREFIISLP